MRKCRGLQTDSMVGLRAAGVPVPRVGSAVLTLAKGDVEWQSQRSFLLVAQRTEILEMIPPKATSCGKPRPVKWPATSLHIHTTLSAQRPLPEPFFIYKIRGPLIYLVEFSESQRR